jgi:hypothetical protein
MTSTAGFRAYLYPPGHPRIEELKGLDAYSYREAAKQDSFTGELIKGWKPLYFQPFQGVTSDGQPIPGLYPAAPARTGEEAPTAEMAAAASKLLEYLPDAARDQVSFPVDSEQWQSWANPEFMQHDTGIRLEFADDQTKALVLALVEASLSTEGYELARTLMRINGFLGDIVGLPALMNEFSYNFALYGHPSETAPWGWQLFGHHVAINCLVAGTQMVMTPVFFGAEPNCIDDGPHEGVIVFQDRIRLGRELMQSLPESQQRQAQTFQEMVDPAMPEGRIHPGDERHLAGAFQDNRVIPYEGIRVSDMDKNSRAIVDAIVEDFTAYLPDGPAAARRREITAYYENTWFSWIGGFGEDEVFYYRLQSPVVILELDHHCGVFLSNEDPQPFHIHTVMRTPNGNDYGRALVDGHGG